MLTKQHTPNSYTYMFDLHTILQSRAMTIMKAAELCDLSYPTVLEIVHNKKKYIALTTLAKICNGLDIHMTDLILKVKLQRTPVYS